MEKLTTVNAFYSYTEEDAKQRSEELCEAVSEKEMLISEKKQVASNYKARIESKENEIKTLAKNLQQNGEPRDYECKMVKDYEKGVKNYFDIISGDLKATKLFSKEDYQTSID